jgi:hypothetical protein
MLNRSDKAFNEEIKEIRQISGKVKKRFFKTLLPAKASQRIYKLAMS